MARIPEHRRRFDTGYGERGTRFAFLALAALFVAFLVAGFGAVRQGSTAGLNLVPMRSAVPVPTSSATSTATPDPTSTPSPSPTLSPTASPPPSPTMSPTPMPTATSIPLATGAAHPIQAAKPGVGAPILMYHYIRVNPVASDTLGYNLSVTPADFAAQMAFLAERGYRTVSIAELLAEIGKPSHDKVIALTFDDGYLDAYTAALPVLRERQMRATFYVVSGFVGRGGYLNADQVREMSAAGMVIGSHTVSHPDLRHLDALSLGRQLVDSRASLEQMVGQPVDDFCYPSGRYNPTVRDAAAAAGYRTATTTYPGIAAGQDPLELPRVRISGGMSLGEFASAIGEGE